MQVRDALRNLTGVFVAAKVLHDNNPVAKQALGVVEVSLQALSAYTEVPLTGFSHAELAAKAEALMPLLLPAPGSSAVPMPNGTPMAVAPIAPPPVPPTPSAAPSRYAAQVPVRHGARSSPGDFEQAVSDAQFIAKNAPNVPEEGFDFATSVSEKASAILDSIQKYRKVIEKQATALSNMRAALEKWLRGRGSWAEGDPAEYGDR